MAEESLQSKLNAIDSRLEDIRSIIASEDSDIRENMEEQRHLESLARTAPEKWSEYDRLKYGDNEIAKAAETRLIDSKSFWELRAQLAENEKLDLEEFPAYDPKHYKLEFPFFECNGSDSLKILGRDKLIYDVSHTIYYQSMKYSPVMITSSRGMGKTFFLKKIGMQDVPESLRCAQIVDAAQYGRIISFDFAREALHERSAEKFIVQLLVYYLCRLFRGCRVNGVNFEHCEHVKDIPSFKGRQPAFNRWLDKALNNLGCDRMMTEYIRLTNIAFGVECKSPPVFLFDKVQMLTDSQTERG